MYILTNQIQTYSKNNNNNNNNTMSSDSQNYMKCLRCKQILMDGWEMKIKNNEFKEIIDINKLRQLETHKFREITKLTLLTDNERAYIADNRRRLNNRKAAKKFRDNERTRHCKLYTDLDSLSQQWHLLRNEKQRLLREIQGYQTAIISLSQPTLRSYHFL